MTERWVMPAEWQPHERTWMAWMEEDYSKNPTSESTEQMHQAWARVANTIVNFEPVTMLVSQEHESEARVYLDPRVEILIAKIDDGWMRDSGPTFVKNPDGKLAAVDWVFNGWGNQGGWRQRDRQVLGLLRTAVPTKPLLTLGATRQGQPRHPLYALASLPWQPWSPAPL